MKSATSLIIFLLVCLTHTAGLGFTTFDGNSDVLKCESSELLETRNSQLETVAYNDVGQMFMGYGDALLNTGMGILEMANRTPNSVQGMINSLEFQYGLIMSALHPAETFNNFVGGIATTWDSGTRGRGELVGTALIKLYEQRRNSTA